MRTTAALAAITAAALTMAATSARAADDAGDRNRRPNVLLICVDDLRPELGADGESHMKTPALDRFASTGRLFRRHYVQAPTCGASRYSMLSGHYPGADGGATWGNGAFGVLKPGDAIVTMPEAFRAAGYRTVSIGKVSHQPSGREAPKEGGQPGGEPEMPDAWDEVGVPVGKWGDAWSAFFGYADGAGRQRGKSPTTEAADVDDAGYPDGLIAEAAVQKLGALKDGGKPFFLAVGFYKPHLPFNAPKKYWDLYDPAALPLPPHRTAPEGVNGIPMHGSGEFFGNYGQHPKDARTSDAYARHVRHAYFAAVSYVDAQIGKVLDAVDALGLAEDTVVIVWGDHGWHLGDHGIWGKHTLYERSLRSAFIVRVPGMPRPGEATHALVGSVDLYPTLMELCGIDAPDGLDGQSFAAALRDPAARGKPVVRGFWKSGGHTGLSYRLDTSRVTIWRKGNGADGEPALVEMYDHGRDPDETRNIAESFPDAIERIEQLVSGGGAQPGVNYGDGVIGDGVIGDGVIGDDGATPTPSR